MLRYYKYLTEYRTFKTYEIDNLDDLFRDFFIVPIGTD